MRYRDGRARILAAARDAFGEAGYTATTTRAIAGRAGMSEPMIFRYFGSKEALFDAAVLTPFTDFVASRVTEWGSRQPGSLSALEETRRFYDQLVDLFVTERAIIVALLAVYHFDEATPSLKRRLESAMRDVIALLESRVVEEARTRGNTGFDIPAVVRVMVAMTFAVVTLPRLFATENLPRARLLEEMARLTIYGTEFRSHPLKDGLAVATDSPDRRPPAVESRAVHPSDPSPSDLSPSGPEWAASDPRLGPCRSALPGRRLDDTAWTAIEVQLAPGQAGSRRPGRPRTDDRAVLEAILHVAETGVPWMTLPTRDFGVSGATCWRRLRGWKETGAWARILPELGRRGIGVEALVGL